MSAMTDKLGLRFVGHVLVRDRDTGAVLVDAFNAIHPENMSEALALSLANRNGGNIHEMVFGNGASTISGTGAISYFPPNTVGAEAQLYNETYRKIVDDRSGLMPEDQKETNRIRVQHVRDTTYTDVIVTCTLDYGEPSGQEAFDDAPNAEGDFIFDEIGLKSYDPVTNDGRLLSHVIFHPVQKSTNRSIEITYTIRIVMT